MDRVNIAVSYLLLIVEISHLPIVSGGNSCVDRHSLLPFSLNEIIYIIYSVNFFKIFSALSGSYATCDKFILQTRMII